MTQQRLDLGSFGAPSGLPYAPHPSWGIEWRHSNTDEAKRIRAERLALWKRQPDDPLAYRAQLVARWRLHRWPLGPSAPGRFVEVEPACWAIYRNRSFRRLLMPGLRARIVAEEREWDRQHAEEMHRHAVEWATKKAARVLERKTGQKVLL